MRGSPKYMQRRLAEGKNIREIIRCLKRYIARELYYALPVELADLKPPAPGPLKRAAFAISITSRAGPNGRTRRTA